jgi:uncharacterized protein YdhG (YjbR/CyaY superfamily)
MTHYFFMKKPENTKEYILGFSKEKQDMLKQIRATVKKIAPDADEVISYGMPAFKKNGMLVWFAACTNHIGFYPGASGIASFKTELSVYKGAKGSVQFPLDKPLPLKLIGNIVRFRLAENELRLKEKKKLRSK